MAHALENIQHRCAKSAAQPVTNFVITTRAGQLLRVQMAPVLGAAGRQGPIVRYPDSS